jgi:CheY-like chemotaxis protein
VTDPGENDVQTRCYGIQVLVAGRRKHWRDEVSAEIRRAGYNITTVDSGVDALTILALGLPMDVLVTDAELLGELCCSRLAIEARALRPNLAIVFAADQDDVVDCVPDALVVPPDAHDGALAGTVSDALHARA